MFRKYTTTKESVYTLGNQTNFDYIVMS